MSNLPPAVFLMGPTASGKTDLAVALVERGPFDIISVDSAMIYRGMDIGTAKPDAEVLSMAPHRLVDIRDPSEPYSAADFREDALSAMREITAAGRIPLLVGGTMLYFKALLEGLAELPAADPVVRAEIEAFAAREGWPAVHAALSRVDAPTAARLHPSDPQRLQRALEVFRLTGIPLSEWHRRHQSERGRAFPWNVAPVALMPPRSLLHERIGRRFRLMIDQGLIAEVEALRARGDLHPTMPSMRAVGYRQTWEYLEGFMDLAQMTERGIIATRQLAKRQTTWLRAWKDAFFVDPSEPNLLDSVLKILGGTPILGIADLES